MFQKWLVTLNQFVQRKPLFSDYLDVNSDSVILDVNDVVAILKEPPVPG